MRPSNAACSPAPARLPSLNCRRDSAPHPCPPLQVTQGEHARGKRLMIFCNTLASCRAGWGMGPPWRPPGALCGCRCLPASPGHLSARWPPAHPLHPSKSCPLPVLLPPPPCSRPLPARAWAGHRLLPRGCPPRGAQGSHPGLCRRPARGGAPAADGMHRPGRQVGAGQSTPSLSPACVLCEYEPPPTKSPPLSLCPLHR